MFIKQLSVFIENREGRLGEVLTALKDSNINIVSLSLADTSDYGLLRMVVSDPEKAKELLSSTDYSMKEICTMCGYSDPNYFSRSFKKNVGVTPTEYKSV